MQTAHNRIMRQTALCGLDHLLNVPKAMPPIHIRRQQRTMVATAAASVSSYAGWCIASGDAVAASSRANPAPVSSCSSAACSCKC